MVNLISYTRLQAELSRDVFGVGNRYCRVNFYLN